MLEGQVRFIVGENSTVLVTGDAFLLRSDIPPTATAEDGPARVLMMTHHPSGPSTGPGERPDWWNPGGSTLPNGNRPNDNRVVQE
ncbi:hypothetical protein [Oceanibaculum sp.]|uniref:hypothetical protein n=1 Tax=Oceanibaculum sp. TaxID=1903597 RepID=UPI0025853194|nr:hypothetical protein [Oceanibaculum sp.]MCH2396143.1 hypothetical protein [Oceanibaculum sp.]